VWTFESKYWYRIQILDCYTDPLGWKDRLVESGNIAHLYNEASSGASLCKNVKDMDELFSSIIELGKGMVVLFTIGVSLCVCIIVSVGVSFHLICLFLSGFIVILGCILLAPWRCKGGIVRLCWSRS
jgi:hypothetical protein